MKTIKNKQIALMIARALVGVLFTLITFLFAFSGSAQAGSLVYIEPGHGGSDGGAPGVLGVPEKTINLGIALKLNALLQANGYPTIMSRYDDATEGRPNPYENIHMDQANAMGAAIFISIHNNSNGDSSAHGTETHYAPKSTADINFANLVQANLVQAFSGVGYNVTDRGIKPHYPNEEGGPWMICRGNMPSILIEGLFVSNPTEAGLLLNPVVQQAIAQGLYSAIAAVVGPPWTPSPEPASPTPSNRGYIVSLYRTLLQRGDTWTPDANSDANEIAPWVNALNNGSFSREGIAYAMMTSHEYHMRMVREMYDVVLGRTAEVSEQHLWANGMDAGLTLRSMRAQIYGSGEFALKYPDNRDYVNFLYTKILNRSASDPGAQGWVNALNNGSMTRSQAAYAIMCSDEYYMGYITLKYLDIMGRAPEPAGLVAWLGGMRNGMTEEVLPAQLYGSTEYYGYHSGS